MKKLIKNKIFLVLIFIVVFALALRVYKLGSYPPSISWDEAAVGYNGYSLTNFLKDEYGKILPLYFQSFGDDKHPIHIYLTAPFVTIFGLNEFSVRLPSAIFGALNVLLIFFIVNLLFKNRVIGLLSSLFLAISPQNIHFSRFNHEANFALFFFMLGLTLFYLAIKNKSNLLPFSILSFTISFLTYHPSKVIVPVIVIFLFAFYIKRIILDRRSFIISLFIVFLISFVVIINPQLLGLSRIGQTTVNKNLLKDTYIFKVTQNEFLGRVNLYFIQYFRHFTPNYLFISGDKNPRSSSQSTGEFYIIDALFLILGVIFLFYKRSKEGFIVLSWAILSPIPSAVTEEAPHAARSMFMMGSFNIISASGFYLFINLFRFRILKFTATLICLIILGFFLFNYLKYYFGEYSNRYAIEWQYGMKQIVDFVKKHEEYNQIFMTDVRSQPYIFFLYYLKTPLPEYLKSVVYNNGESKSFSTVSYFDQTFIVKEGGQSLKNIYFGGWDPIESLPQEGRLYVISPSHYDGLRYKSSFDVKKIIYYPNGTVAFYLISKL